MPKNSKIDDVEAIGESLVARKDTRPVCEVCGLPFGNKGLLAIHMKTEHSQPVIEAVTVEEVPQPVEDVPAPTATPAVEEEFVPTKEEEIIPVGAGRIDRGEWYNSRTAVQIFVLNNSGELAFIDSQIKLGLAKTRAEVVMAALREYIKTE